MFASYMKRLFNPILPSPYKDSNGDVAIELISDAMVDFSSLMRVRVFSLNSITPIMDSSIRVETVTFEYCLPNLPYI
jgi:hypothetical protein